MTALFFFAAAAAAVLQPENTAVVVNADSPASMAVANEFIALRRIPPDNIVYLELGAYPAPRVIGVAEFREKILLPVLHTLTQRGLDGRIDCIAWSCGIPAEIDLKADIQAAGADHAPPRSATPVGSITGLTFLYQLTLAADIRYLAGRVNFYACRGDIPSYAGAKLASDQAEACRRAEELLSQGQPEAARELLSAVLHDAPLAATPRVLLARLHAAAGQPSLAAAVLRPLIEQGWDDVDALMSEPEIVAIAAEPPLKELIDALRLARYGGGALRPTGPFANRLAYLPSGVVLPPQEGLHYMLSTVLSLDGPRGLSVDEARRCLRRAAAADATRPASLAPPQPQASPDADATRAPTGTDVTHYFMANRDVRSRTRSWAFPGAVRALEALGVRAKIAKGQLPPPGSRVAGLMAGSAVLNVAAAGLEFAPGAIAEHFTSHGGVLQGWASQTPMRDFLLAGAAGTGGTVTEPYAIGDKFPTAFMQVHYAAGCSLAEAFFQSITSPYQYLVAGDPLCTPWARPVSLTVEGIAPGQTLAPEPTTLRLRAESPEGILGFLLHVDGRLVKSSPSVEGKGLIELDVAALDGGWHELVLTAVAADAIHSVARRRIEFAIATELDDLELNAEIDPDGNVTVTAAQPQAAAIELWHNARLLATIEGNSGTARIPAARLGPGPVQIAAVARIADKGDGKGGKPPQRLRARPLELLVPDPPAFTEIQETPGTARSEASTASDAATDAPRPAVRNTPSP